MGADREIPGVTGDLAFPIAMSLRDWLFADATVDNVVSLASEDLDDRSVSIGTRIREAGWSVTGTLLDAERASGRWPPSEEAQGQVVTISLTADELTFVVSALRSSQETEEFLGQHEEAARSALLQEVITAALGVGP